MLFCSYEQRTHDGTGDPRWKRIAEPKHQLEAAQFRGEGCVNTAVKRCHNRKERMGSFQRSRHLTSELISARNCHLSSGSMCVFWSDGPESARSDKTLTRLQCVLIYQGKPARWPTLALSSSVQILHLPQDFPKPSVRSSRDQKHVHQQAFKKDVLPFTMAYASVCAG